MRTSPRHVTFTPALTALAAALTLGGACAERAASSGSTTAATPSTTAAPAPTVAHPSLRPPQPPLPSPLPGDPMKATIHRLANGLTVYISPDHSEPRVSAHIVVRAGSRTDPPDSTGLAHYLEHMLFKGTERLGTLDGAAERPHIERIAALYDQLFSEKDSGRRDELLAQIDRETQASSKWLVPNEFDRIFESMGFRGNNAMTSDDWTMYLVEIPSNRLAHWARMEGARLKDPVFRLFLPELEAVYEEKNQSIDSPENQAWEKLIRMLYPKHPYGTQPTIGHAEHLKNPAYRQMVEYFRRWYVPNNMAVILSGDVNAASALPLLEREFGGWQARPLSPPPPAEMPALTGRLFDELKAEGEEQVTMAWQTAPGGHEDELPLTVMDALMLDQGAGLMSRELLLPQKIPGGASQVSFLSEAGQWIVVGTARDGQSLEEVERLLRQTVDHLKAGHFDDKDLAAAILNLDLRNKREHEDNGQRAMRMAQAFVFGEPWERVATTSQRLKAVSRADVLRVANRYLGDGLAVVYRRKGKLDRPKLSKPKISPIAMDATRQSPFGKELVAMPVSTREPTYLRAGVDYQRGKLPAGKLLSALNQQNDLFSIAYQFDLGNRRQPLLCHAIDVQRKAGAGPLSAVQLQAQFYALGASVQVWCGTDVAQVTVDGVDRFMEQTLAWVDRWFREPRFEQSDVDKRLATVLTDRRNALEDPRQAAQALAEFAELGARSGYLAEPSNQVLQQARAESLRPLLAAFPDHAHSTLYFGPRPGSAAAAVIGFGKKHRPLPPRPPVVYRRSTRPTIFLLDRELAQGQLSLTFPVGKLRRQDMGRSLALSHYLGGGMHSLMFQEIREARGLAYAVDAEHRLGGRLTDETALTGYMATQADKTAEALARFLELVRETGVLDSRLATTQASVEERIRSQRRSGRAIPYRVAGWEDMGEPDDPMPRLRQQIAGLRAPALQSYLRGQANRPFAAALTADKSRLDLARLAKLGRVEEVKVEQLFSYGPFPPVPATPIAVQK